MDPIIDVAMPAVVFLMMTMVGHSLTPGDLRRSATDLRAVVTATVGQLVLLPVVATVIVLVLAPAPAIVGGLILVAASPGGSVSNFYSCLARANTALSVTLTVISCLLSVVTMPALVAAGFFFWLDDTPEFELPLRVLVVQLLVLVAVPICVGMILRRWRPAQTGAREVLLRRLSLAALVGVVSYVVFDQWTALIASAQSLVLAAALFTVLAMTMGYALAWVIGRPVADRLTFLIEFSCRNLTLAVVVAVSVLGRADLVTFAAVLLLVQALVTLILVAVLHRQPASS
jgi:BASS family bile acid:Na+ symporter